MNTQDPKYQQKSKAISSAEPNYLSQFEMRYPVEGSVLKVSSTYFRITQSPFAIEFEVGIQTKIQLGL